MTLRTLLLLAVLIPLPLFSQTKSPQRSQSERTMSILSLLSGEEADSSARQETKVIDWGWLGTAEPMAGFDPGALVFITEALGEEGYYSSGSELPSTTRRIWTPQKPTARWSVGSRMTARRHGTVTSGFGWRERFGRHHWGIDIAMNVGDTVRTPMNGTVDRIGYEARGYGHYLVIVHDDGMETRYAHLSTTLVPAGVRVKAGQPVAVSGNTGNSTGPHLHFESRVFGIPVDPETLFNVAGTALIPKR